MVENVRGQCGRAAVTRVASSRVELRACRVLACRGVHVVGVNPCAAPASCPAHYGLCVPVVVTLTDAASGLGTVQPDEEAILKIVEANRRKFAAKRTSKSANQEDRSVPESVEVSPPPPAAAIASAQAAESEDQPSGVDVEAIVEAVERWVNGQGAKEEVESAQQREARQYKELVGTLAELAAEKRAGRVAPGPEPPTGAPRHHETVQLFSELMQTDDVSTIAAQIANQAELIYQTWKTTGLNPTELIRYHSVNTEGSPLSRSEQASDGETIPSGPPSATVKPRTPVRNISPAPPGSSPAVSRKFIEPALHNGRPHASSPVRNISPRPYIPPGTSPHSPSGQQQPPPVFPTSNGGLSPHQSPRQVYSSSTSPSPVQTQGSLRSYSTSASPLSPRGSLTQPPPPPERSSSYPGVDPTQHQQEGPYDTLVNPDLGTSLQELVNSFVLEDKARHHAAAVAALASQRPKSAPSSIQEALQRFERQMAITSRSAGHAPDLASSPPPPIGTMGRFAQLQMQQQQLQQPQLGPSLGGSSMSMSSSTSTSSVTINTMGRRYGGTRSDSSVSSEWSRMQVEHDSRSRRSASPNSPVSQPGWNEAPPPNTSTWPLKNKQPAAVERKTSKQSVSSGISSSTASSSSFSSSSSSSSSVTTSTNYITTLEARVESSGQKYSGVPLRHKVVTMSAVDQEEERLMHALRTGTLIDDGEHLRPLSQVRPTSTPSLVSSPQTSPINSTVITSAAPTHSEASPLSPSSRKPKYSISVTVDVDKPIEVTHQGTHQQHHLQQKIHQPQIQHQLQHHHQQQHQQQQQLLQQQKLQFQQKQQQQQQVIKVGSIRSSIKPGKEVDMSMVDFAKVRYQESQQHPHSSLRLDDHRSMSPKQIVNGDGRVMMARTRFENGSASLPDSIWRGPLGIQADEVGSTLPEFYRRKLRKMRKAGSPEPSVVGSISALPHPELTDQQKAHIRERSQSPTAGYNSAGVAIRPFLTQGSVAERVLIFERAPAEMKPKSGAPLTAGPAPEKRRPAISTWRDPNEVRSLAQDGLQSSPSPTSPPSPARQTEPPVSVVQDAKPSTYVRESSAAQKENARPLPSSGGSSPVSPLSPTPAITSLASTSPTTTSGHPASPSSPLGLPGSTASPLHSARVPNTLRRHTKSTKNLLIPRFYYPMGRPTTQVTQEQALARVAGVFREQGGQVARDNMDPLMHACSLPLYWKAPLFIAAGGDKLGYLTQEQFSDYWSRVISTCHDMASRFVRVLSRGVRSYLLPEDFLSMIQDVVDTHPGLTFLKEATEFHSRYVHTVIARIYYCVNRSWSGRITLPELRRSNLLQVISYLEEEEDINQITDYFSYEHFYVIYCKFWELDTDHDLFIDKHDLAKHNERALSWRMIERIFSGAVTRGRLQKQDRMGYQEFVWFLISEEDKRHPTAIEYWFRCMDLDGDGYLSMYELEYFYEEQLQRMEALGIETLPFHDCLCQMLDMVRPEEMDKISLRDLKKCRMTPIFFDTFFNLEKYLDHEQRDPFASHRAEDDGPEVSDWDRYAAEEYELLVAEEGGADHQDDMFYGDEDELSMGCEDALDSTPSGGRGSVGGVGSGGALSKHSPLSATVTNLAADPMDVDDDYPDYADSDDYQY